MKWEFENRPEWPFEYVKPRETFMFEGELFLRTMEENQSVNVDSGCIVIFCDEDVVQMVEAKIIIK